MDGRGIELRKTNSGRRPRACHGKATLVEAKSRVFVRPGVVQEPYARRETARARTERPRRHPGLIRRRIGPGSQKRKPGVNASEESNIGIVPAKPPNKVGRDTGGGGGGGTARDQGERYG